MILCRGLCRMCLGRYYNNSVRGTARQAFFSPSGKRRRLYLKRVPKSKGKKQFYDTRVIFWFPKVPIDFTSHRQENVCFHKSLGFPKKKVINGFLKGVWFSRKNKTFFFLGNDGSIAKKNSNKILIYIFCLLWQWHLSLKETGKTYIK